MEEIAGVTGETKISKVQTYGVALRKDGSKRLTYAITLPRFALEFHGIQRGDSFAVCVENKNFITLRRVVTTIV